ncbi:peptidase T [Persicobacter sp. CCB-QB2]|uniref:peptidase T n=1 Tax=Persicobacter sp. CCB-QB2 TaxID=1561025 RepID=UPI0006A9A754|nr:peptidase T [Persicobacter sp. CCB-QB2]
MKPIVERFIRYVKFDTESEAGVEAIPSTPKQRLLAEHLVAELNKIGMEEVTIDEHAYVMATLPSNVAHAVPVIGFVAHMDTSPDFSGANVQPKIWENYQGGDLVLNEAQNIVLKVADFPEVEDYIGQDLITTDGTTLLGADDKAGVTEIVTAMEYLIQHPEIKHGKIRICFTPDEEVGRGADLFDVEKFGAEYAYTLDGGPVGELEYENFNAAGAEIQFKGVSVHPGSAKDKMVNAMRMAAAFAMEFPEKEVPEHTEGYEGFFHLVGMDGNLEDTKLQYIIRDHDHAKYEARKQFMTDTVEKYKKLHGEDMVSLKMVDQYFNMREKVEPVMHIVDVAEEAMKQLDIKPLIKPIRGGTDGSRLSYMGLPCPNIFAGGHNFHGKFEFVPVQSMEKATEVIVRIAELTAKN